MKFIELPALNLRNHRIRSILTALGIAIALGSLLALVGLSRGLERGWVLSMEEKGTHILALHKRSIDLLSASLDEKLAERIRRTPGVSAAVPALGDMVELETGQMAYLTGWPLDSAFWKTLTLIAGKVPGAANPDSVVLGEALAGMIGKRPGDSLLLGGRDLIVAGVTRQSSVLDDRSVMLPLPTMQRLVGREGKASGFHIRVDHPEKPAEVARTIASLSAAFPELSFTETSQIAQNNHITKLLRAIAWSSSTIALGMAFVAVLNTLLMSVTERMRDIGLFRAVGWGTARVMVMVVLEGLLLAAAGSVLGIAFGLLTIRWLVAHPQLGGLIQPEVTTRLVFEGASLALLIGGLGGLYPAWRATRLRPIELLRSE